MGTPYGQLEALVCSCGARGKRTDDRPRKQELRGREWNKNSCKCEGVRTSKAGRNYFGGTNLIAGEEARQENNRNTDGYYYVRKSAD